MPRRNETISQTLTRLIFEQLRPMKPGEPLSKEIVTAVKKLDRLLKAEEKLTDQMMQTFRDRQYEILHRNGEDEFVQVAVVELDRILDEGGYINYEKQCICDAKGTVLYHDLHLRKVQPN
jgi:hypothetical protein